ncbi:MAG TPA: hypothetical protein VN829_25035 [Dongiaceae bacterium]|nr:hypothetical protein [Dongiaceae bacterium]
MKKTNHLEGLNCPCSLTLAACLALTLLPAAAHAQLATGPSGSTNSPAPPGDSTNGLAGANISTNPVVMAAPAPPVDTNVQRVVRPTAGGAVGDFGAHVVWFANDADTPSGAISIQLPQPPAWREPITLRTRVVGLCYWLASGPAAGQTVLVASLTNSIGEILPPASVHYPDALGPGLGLIYNYTQSSIEQDLIINTQLPAPASVLPGADESQVMLGVITEFLDQTRPRHTPVTVDLSQAKGQLGLGAGPDSLAGEDLDFGPMRILGSGQAFFMGSASGPTVPTATAWVEQPDPDPSARLMHYYVVDSTPYVLVKAQLATLPASQQPGHAQFKPARDLKTMLAALRRPHTPALAPSPLVARRSSLLTSPMAVAKAGAEPPRGLLLDYIMVAMPLLNIDFGGVAGSKVGPAAAGRGTNDYWNPWYYPYNSSVTLTNLAWADSSRSTVGATVQNAPGDWANGAADPMMNTYMYANQYTGNITITLTNLPSGTWDFYLYGHGPTADNSIFYVGTNGPLATTTSSTTWSNGLPANWTNGQQYVLFSSVPVTNGRPVVITVTPDSLGYSLICGLQAECAAPTTIYLTTNSSYLYLGTTNYFGAGTPASPYWGSFDTILHTLATPWTRIVLGPGTFFTHGSQSDNELLQEGQTLLGDPAGTTVQRENGVEYTWYNIIWCDSSNNWVTAQNLTMECDTNQASNITHYSVWGIALWGNNCTVSGVKVLHHTAWYAKGEAAAIMLGSEPTNALAWNAPWSSNNVVTGCTVTNCAGDDAINGIGWNGGGIISSNNIYLPATNNPPPVGSCPAGKCINASGYYGLTCLSNNCFGGRWGFYQDPGWQSNVVIQGNSFIGQSVGGVALGCYTNNCPLVGAYIYDLTISGNTIKVIDGDGSAGIDIMNIDTNGWMSITNVTISSNTIASYPGTNGSPLEPICLATQSYGKHPQGGTNYYFWTCYIGHNKIEPYLNCQVTDEFQMQLWTIDSNTALDGSSLGTTYFPTNGTYTNYWWPGHY